MRPATPETGDVLEDPSLTDAEKLCLLALASWDGRRPPTNAQVALRCGWRLPTGRPSGDKARVVLRRLERAGKIRRVGAESKGSARVRIEIVGRHPRAEIATPSPGGNSPPDPGGSVKDRAMAILAGVAALGMDAPDHDLWMAATRLQSELAGCFLGNPSRRFLALVEAVAFGYDFAPLRALIASELSRHGPEARVDLRGCIHRLHPDPRHFLGLGRNPPLFAEVEHR